MELQGKYVAMVQAVQPQSSCSRYPAQGHVGGDKKIPSIIYYDQQHTVRAVGAEALQPHITEQAEDESWIKLEWSASETSWCSVGSPVIYI